MLIPVGLILVVGTIVLKIFGLVASRLLLGLIAATGVTMVTLGVHTARQMEPGRRLRARQEES